MQTYNSFNALAIAQTFTPLQTQMSVFNALPSKQRSEVVKSVNRLTWCLLTWSKLSKILK